jgi:hypothetical protein
MNLRRLASAAAAAIIAAGIGVSITAASRQTPPISPAPIPVAKVLVDCEGNKTVEPRTFILACADGNSYLDKLTWTSWTGKVASAYGILTENDCLPYCAAGHFHSYPILAVTWGSQSYKGSQRYTELTIIFTTGKRPPWYSNGKPAKAPQTITYPLWAPLSTKAVAHPS